MVYYRPLCLYVSEKNLARAGFSNLEGSHSMFLNIDGKEAALYHGCFQNYFNERTDFINIVVVGVRRKNREKIDYYFGAYHREDHEIGGTEEINELLERGKQIIKRKNRIALSSLEKRIEEELGKSISTPTP